MEGEKRFIVGQVNLFPPLTFFSLSSSVYETKKINENKIPISYEELEASAIPMLQTWKLRHRDMETEVTQQTSGRVGKTGQVS